MCVQLQSFGLPNKQLGTSVWREASLTQHGRVILGYCRMHWRMPDTPGPELIHNAGG